VTKKKCGACYGFGMWAMGDAVPMGQLDAEDGMPTRACPECGANANPSASTDELTTGIVCDNCGKKQEPGDWYTGRDGHWWCDECKTIVHRHERVYGAIIVTCPECGWTITVAANGGMTTRDRTEPDDSPGKVIPENGH